MTAPRRLSSLSGWLFLASFLLLAWLYNYPSILVSPPQGPHLWRQCDCLSITANYAGDRNAFLQPAIHNLGTDNRGRTVSEFPLVQYTVAQLWRLFGTNEAIYRAVVLLLFFAGLFALFRLTERLLRDSVIAILSTLLLFTSPILAYYGNNFLSDIPAFAFACIGMALFFRYAETGDARWFLAFALSFLLAGMLKASAMLGFAAVTGACLLETAGMGLREGRRVFRPLRDLGVIAAVIALQAAWYLWARHYNLENRAGGYFLVGILPVWELDAAAVRTTLDAIREHVKNDHFRAETQALLLLMLLFTIVYGRKTSRLLLTLTLLTVAGSLLFAVLFFQALKDHDYYVINIFIVPPLVMAGFWTTLKARFPRIFDSWIVRGLLLLFLIHNADFARRRMADRYDPAGWQNELYTRTASQYRELGPKLSQFGIGPGDRVLCLSDNTIDVSLYFLGRKGWTNYAVALDPRKIRDKIAMGADYLLVFDETLAKNDSLRLFTNHPAGRYRDIGIYNLRKLE